MKFKIRTERTLYPHESLSDYLKPVYSFYKMELMFSEDVDTGTEVVREWFVKIGNLDTLKTFCDMLADGNDDIDVIVSFSKQEIVIRDKDRLSQFKTEDINTGRMIKKAREKAGLTRQELADILEIECSLLADYENGARQLKYITEIEIFKAIEGARK